MIQKNVLAEKLREAVDSVLPIALIVAVLCLFFVPVGSGLMLAFLVGTGMILAGMALFTLGSEQSMSQIGNLIGSRLTKSRNILLILSVSFVMGVVITMSEPDLQVLAAYVPGIDRMTLVLTVSVGVGLFLAVCMVRILTGFALRWLLPPSAATKRPRTTASAWWPCAPSGPSWRCCCWAFSSRTAPAPPA